MIRLLSTPKKKTQSAARPEEVPQFDHAVQALAGQYSLLADIERTVRAVVDLKLRTVNPNYQSHESFMDKETRGKALTAKDAEIKAFGSPLVDGSIIDYVDFAFVFEMMAKHRADLFTKDFPLEAADWERFKKDLVPIRNAIMHCRPLAKSGRTKLEYIHQETVGKLRPLISE